MSSQLELMKIIVIIWFWGWGLVLHVLSIRYEIWKGKCCLYMQCVQCIPSFIVYVSSRVISGDLPWHERLCMCQGLKYASVSMCG